MAYATAALLKSYLGITGATDDTLLGLLLDRATAAIDAYTGNVFVSASATRYLEQWMLDDDGLTLWTDGPFTSITTLKNGDSSNTAIANTEYTLVDRNAGAPYWAIRLKSNSTVSWTWDTDYHVECTANWGFSAAPPDDIVHACIRLAGYYYRQKDAQVFDVTAQPDAGIITIPQGMPADVVKILKPYRQNVGWL